MFNAQELTYLLVAVDALKINTAQEARNKAHMILKVSDLLSLMEKAPEPPEGEKKTQSETVDAE